MKHRDEKLYRLDIASNIHRSRAVRTYVWLNGFPRKAAKNIPATSDVY